MRDWKVGDLLIYKDEYNDLCEYKGDGYFIWLTFDGEMEEEEYLNIPVKMEEPEKFRKLTKLELALR